MIDRIRVVAGLAVDKDNRVFVAKRPPDKKRPDMYEYPGGKVERAEGDARALVREWQEELKVTPNVGHRIARINFDLESPVVISLYHVTLSGQSPETVEHVDARWVDPLYAVERLACVPSLYLFYPHVRAFLRQLAPNVPR